MITGTCCACNAELRVRFPPGPLMDITRAVYGLLILAVIPYITVATMVFTDKGDAATYALIIGGSNTAIGVVGGVINPTRRQVVD